MSSRLCPPRFEHLFRRVIVRHTELDGTRYAVVDVETYPNWLSTVDHDGSRKELRGIVDADQTWDELVRGAVG